MDKGKRKAIVEELRSLPFCGGTVDQRLDLEAELFDTYRTDLNVSEGTVSTEWSCEHCGKPEIQSPRHCDFCRGGMCFECTETYDEQDECPIQEGKNV